MRGRHRSGPGRDTAAGSDGELGYLRLRRDDYGDADLRALAGADPRAQPWSQAYVFFKHEDEGAAPRLAQRLMELASAGEPAPA